MEGRVTADVTPNDNASDVQDEVQPQDSVDRISDWVDAIARADGRSPLPPPAVPQPQGNPTAITERYSLRQLGDRLRRRGVAHIPPILSGVGRARLQRPPIPVVETEESELLSPSLDAVHRHLESREVNQAQPAGQAVSSEVDGRASGNPAAPPEEPPQIVLPEGDSLPGEGDSLSVVEAEQAGARVRSIAQAAAAGLSTLGTGVEAAPPPTPLQLTAQGAAADMDLQGRVDPSTEFFDLASRAYDAYKDFQLGRTKAYRHLNMPPPDVVIHPPGGAVIRASYYAKLVVSTCDACHERHVVMSHKQYVMTFSMIPVLCHHRMPVTWMYLDDSPEGEAITLPSPLTRIPPGPGSVSSGGSVSVDRLNRDLRKVNARARTALALFERLEGEGDRYYLAYYPEMQQQQARRMRALIEAEVEECRDDIQLRAESLAGDLAQSELESIASPPVGEPQEEPQPSIQPPAGARHARRDYMGMLGPPLPPEEPGVSSRCPRTCCRTTTRGLHSRQEVVDMCDVSPSLQSPD